MNDVLSLRSALTRDADNFVYIPVAAAVLVGAFLVDFRTLLVTLVAITLFTLPGVIVARLFFAPVRALVYGFPLGYTLTSLLLMTVVALRGWDFLSIALAYVICVGVLVALVRYQSARLESAERPDTHVAAQLPLTVALATTITVILLYFPLARAGILTPNGYAYTGLFGHDFILRGVDSVALANAVPSDNYFFAGVKTYNYYILWYMLPATVYNLLGRHPEITGIISLLDLINIPIFGALLYYALAGFVRATLNESIQSMRLGLIFVVLFLLAYSYHWLFFAVTEFADPAQFPALAHASEQMGPVSTSWVKDFLFQPHCVLGLMQFLAAMQLSLEQRPRSWAVWAGVLLGSVLLTDVVLFLVISTTFAIWYLLRGSLSSKFPELTRLTLSGGAVIVLAFLLKVFTFPEYSNKIVISPYVTAIVTLPVLLPLCLGPLAVFGPLMLRVPKRFASQEGRLLLILLFVSLFFMLFVTEVVEGNVFLRKSLMALRLPLFVFSGAYLYAFLRSGKPQMAFIVLVALAVPTVVTDLYATSQTSDPRYTMYIAPDEMEAAHWLRTNTRPDSVVQSLIEYHGGIFDYSLPICFGERRAALGLWQMAFQRYPNREAITQRVRKIQILFSTNSDEERSRLAQDLHVEYVMVGPRERARFPGVDARFLSDATHFKPEHVAPTVTIFKVRT